MEIKNRRIRVDIRFDTSSKETLGMKLYAIKDEDGKEVILNAEEIKDLYEILKILIKED